MAFYSEELIEDIKSSNDIVDIISEYVTLKRSGRNYFGLCPFHNEKSSSFSVSPDKQIFHCFGCGEGGNVIKFLMKIENIDFLEAIEILAQRARIELPKDDKDIDVQKLKLKEKVYEINAYTARFFYNNLSSSENKVAQEYLINRQIDINTVKRFGMGFSTNDINSLYKSLKEKGYSEEEILASGLVVKKDNSFIDRFRNRLIFPIFDVRDRIIAFGGRVLDKSLPKYINSPETIAYVKGKNLFGLNIARKSGAEKVIVVEGYMDAISLHQRGINNAVASLGTALTENQGRLLRKYFGEVIICYDADAAGQEATLRGLDILSKLGCRVKVLRLNDCKDPDEYVIKHGVDKFKLLVEHAISLVEYKISMLRTKIDINTPDGKLMFLNKISQILSKVDNDIEKDIYVKNIAKETEIKQEAIYTEINKLVFGNRTYVNTKSPSSMVYMQRKQEGDNSNLYKTEKLLLEILFMRDNNSFNKIRGFISPDDFKYELHKKIAQKVYKAYENGTIKTQDITTLFENDEEINFVTGIIQSDSNLDSNIEKAVNDLLETFNKERIESQKKYILEQLKNREQLQPAEIEQLENELGNLILQNRRFKN